jgi:hypothetical protein
MGDLSAADAARPGSGPVEEYLDQLFDRLAGSGAAGRRVLDEVADHLRASVTAGVESGLSELDAEWTAVARFGPAGQVARGLRPAAPLGFALRRLAASATVLGSIGLVAVGLSGLVAEVFGVLLGKEFVAGDVAGVTYTPERCVQYFRYYSGLTDCQAAAAAHHFDEVVQYRVLAGVLGILALLAFFALRRFGPLAGPAWAPRPDVVAIVGAGAFAGGVVLFGGSGALQLLGGLSVGAGQLLAAGLVSLAAFAGFVPLLLRHLRRQPA